MSEKSTNQLKLRKEVIVCDCDGREITLRKPNFAEKKGFMAAYGETISMPVMLFTQSLMYVYKIDGEVIPVPSSEVELDWLGAKLDEADDGLDVVANAVNINFLTKIDSQDKALKNS